MIKILRVSTHPSKNRHGVGLHPYKISETNKFKTIFVCPSLPDGDSYVIPVNYVLVPSTVFFEKRPTKGSIIKILSFHIRRVYKILLFSFFCIRQARKYNVDVIHIHSPMYFLITLWGKINKKLTCITYHGTDYLRIKDSNIYNVLSKKYIDLGFCISPHMLDKMSNNHRKVQYAPNGVDTTLFFNKNKERDKILLAVGSLKKEKSYTNLIKAFKKVANSISDYELHIAGDGPLRSDLQKLAIDIGLNDKVVFCGNLKMEALVEKYNTAECFILSSYTEGFPKVVLEAIFTGCKVVATDVGSVNTFLPEEYVIPDDSINHLADYIIKVINESRYEVNIDNLKSRFTWTNVINNYEKTYEDYLRGNKKEMQKKECRS